jgi:hypothetical protein
MGDTEGKPDGTGFIATCATCGRSRLVHRDAIMSGRWMDCPHCTQDKRKRAD